VFEIVDAGTDDGVGLTGTFPPGVKLVVIGFEGQRVRHPAHRVQSHRLGEQLILLTEFVYLSSYLTLKKST
jgi:hypothetical protein